MSRVIVDPVTRIEGHLRIEAEVDGGAVQRRMVVVDDVPRHRADSEGPRSARRVGVHAADLRRLHDRARDRLDSRGRERHRRGAAAECAAAAQPDHCARSACRITSIHFYHLHALDWVDIVSALSADPVEDLVARRSRSPTGRCRARRTSPACAIASRRSSIAASSAVRERLLGPSGLPAAARGQPDGGRALPRGARLAAGVHQAARRARRQEPAPAELPGRRHGDADRSEQPSRAECRHHRRAESSSSRRRATSSSRVYIPDLLAVAAFYKDWAGHGRGVGNYLVYGEYPEDDAAQAGAVSAAGIIRGARLVEGRAVRSRQGHRVRRAFLVRVRRAAMAVASPVPGRDGAELHRARRRRTSGSTPTGSTPG